MNKHYIRDYDGPEPTPDEELRTAGRRSLFGLIIVNALAIIGIVCVLVGAAHSQTIDRPTRITPYDFQCQDASGNKISDHQQQGIAIVECYNNAQGAIVQGGRYRINRSTSPPVEPPAPPPPELTAPTLTATVSPNTTNPDNSNVTLLWTAVTGATSYEIERCAGASCTNFAPLATATVLAYANTNIPGGLTLRYRARGVDGSRQGPYSSVVTVVTPAAPAPPPVGAAFLRINAGGSTVDGYEADRSFVGGAVSSACNRTMAGVYQSRRWANPGFEYRIPVTNGTYVVRLLWQECWNNSAGKRVLSANVEGQPIPAFDTWGADGSPIMHERAVTVTDGVLNISLAATVSDAMLNAIEISQTGADPEPPPPPATGSATLSWTPPTTNTDGTTLSNLAGFRILYGTSAASLTRTIQVANAGASSYVVDQLSSGTWHFSVRAYTSSGTESLNSNIASRVVP